MQPIRYGVVGAGVIANYMARAFTEGRDSIAVALADVNRTAAEKLAPALGQPRIVADYRELLADPAIDAVYLATPPFLHRPMTIEALRAGKHVCCEKPFMLTQAEVRDVLAVQREHPHLKVNCASSRYLATGTAQRARALIAAGDLGRLYRVSYEQVIGAPKPGSTLPPWRNDPAKNGGGITFDWGPYDLDWLAFVLGDLFRPRVVFAVTGHYFPLTPERVPPCLDVDGYYSAEIICDHGLTIHWERRAAEHGPSRHNIELRGTRAGLDTYFMPLPERPGMVHHAYLGTDELKSTVLPDAPPNWDDTMVNPIRDLSRAILEDRPTANTLADNLRIHGVLDAVLASARTQQAIRVAE
ncbi:Gfo/Idh/MocA family oxidoreductase [Horticoccus luteus]|uniref:Gfo/Idh/MocA family oxidoreductase n=1 Tax=Horticoccus luteus TaxID=2862869 RepID=A0A8F9TTT9_9BACT|nr:Gfo/Idh/MocA family oxidoreductase [Horticoccus luteus]QYM79139.1 Gfo/Idh/MocA family oxidoreductase [Horticoccus luteus]